MELALTKKSGSDSEFLFPVVSELEMEMIRITEVRGVEVMFLSSNV
jgi:hypothetical protein